MKRSTRQLMGAGFLVVLIVMAACGDDDTVDEVTDSGGSEAASTTAAVERIPCQVPEPTPLAVGDSVEGQIDGFDECFTVDVPAGAAQLAVALTGLTDEINLVVGYGDTDTIVFRTGDVWSSSEPGTADEVLTIEDPSAGIYFINVAIGTINNVSPFTLTVSTS